MKYTIDTTNKTITLLEECTLDDISILLTDIEDKIFELKDWKLIPKETIKIEKEPQYVPYKLQEQPCINPYPFNPITQPQTWYICDTNTTNTGNLINK